MVKAAKMGQCLTLGGAWRLLLRPPPSRSIAGNQPTTRGDGHPTSGRSSLYGYIVPLGRQWWQKMRGGGELGQLSLLNRCLLWSLGPLPSLRGGLLQLNSGGLRSQRSPQTLPQMEWMVVRMVEGVWLLATVHCGCNLHSSPWWL